MSRLSRLAGMSGTTTWQALATVFRRPRYVAIGASVTLVLYLLMSALAQYRLLRAILPSDLYSPNEKIVILARTATSWTVTLDPVTAVLALLTIVSVGLNISLLTFFLRRRITGERSAGASAGAIFVSLFGVGCGSCGSVLLSSVIGTTASASFIGFLPFRGKELGVAAFALSIFALTRVAKKITTPTVCRVTGR